VLDEPQVRPWVAGISIHAINAAIIVRNRPEARVARLCEFWTAVIAEPFRGGLVDYSDLLLKCCAKKWFMPGTCSRRQVPIDRFSNPMDSEGRRL
jgi:predicted acylesterase/phospholipase RssA